MPLRDHFRPPVDDVHSWDELHGMWPAMMIHKMIENLPEPFYAGPTVHLGKAFEVDIATFNEANPLIGPEGGDNGDAANGGQGGVAVATYAPPAATLTCDPWLPHQDIYRVRIYDSRRSRRLVATIEIISPSNKDRPKTRSTFVSKAATLLKNGVCVTFVDVVSTMNFNLYAELMDFLDSDDPALKESPQPMYAVSMRTRFEEERRLMDNWYYPLTLGKPLPTLPIWLNETYAIPLDLEASYKETCRTLRIR